MPSAPAAAGVGDIATVWQRHPDDCPRCGRRVLTSVRKPLIEKARGTQQSIIGYRIAKECSSCGWTSET